MSDENEALSKSNWFDKIILFINARLAVIATLAATIWTFYLGVTEYISNNIERNISFNRAYKEEEDYWRNLYNEYLKAVDETDDIEGKNPEYNEFRERQFSVLLAFANKPVQEFDEYRLGYLFEDNKKHKLAYEHFNYLKKTLIYTMNDPNTTGAFILNKNFDDANSTNESSSSKNGQVVGENQYKIATVSENFTIDTVGSISYQTKILSYGSPTGYNIDVFWCVGDRQSINFDQAGNVAKKLALLATPDNMWGQGKGLGRIRFLPLPLDKQTSNGLSYPSSGYEVRYERNNNEEKVVAELLVSEFKESSGVAFKTVAVGMVTNRYLSMFVCGEPEGVR